MRKRFDLEIFAASATSSMVTLSIPRWLNNLSAVRPTAAGSVVTGRPRFGFSWPVMLARLATPNSKLNPKLTLLYSSECPP